MPKNLIHADVYGSKEFFATTADVRFFGIFLTNFVHAAMATIANDLFLVRIEISQLKAKYRQCMRLSN